MSINDGSDKDAKGFSGLSSLLSDVDDLTDQQPVTNSDTKNVPSSQQDRAKKKKNSSDTNSQKSEYTKITLANNPAPDLKWLWIGLALFFAGFVWFASQDQGAEKSKPSYTPYTPTKSSPSLDSSTARPLPKQTAPARPIEEKPPYGKNKVLGISQLRYCLAEKIRIDAAESIISNYSQSDINRFNSIVNDYNNRCGEFRYRRGNLTHAQRDIDLYMSQIRAEGKARFVKPKPKPNETVRAIQERLNASGYNAGSADGYMGKKTRLAIMAYQKNSRITADGLATNSLLNLLHRPVKQLSNPTATQPKQIKPKPNETVRAIQKRLNKLGYNAGSADGYMGKNTRLAIMAYQRKNKMIVNGIVSNNLFNHMKQLVKKEARRSQSNFSNHPGNLKTCLSGDYPSLCKHQLLTQEQTVRVNSAEKRVNYNTCVSGDYPSLCKHQLLTREQAMRVNSAEKRVNYNTCISGDYPSLCKHQLLTREQAVRVNTAEKRADN